MQPSSLPATEESSALAPAPWQLEANAYLFAVKLPRVRESSALFVSNELAEPRIRRIGWMMYVDYSEAPVGPYRELLFIPGTFTFGLKRLPSITKIYVSTQASVDNGRRNWGIPKELASFEVEHEGKHSEHVRMRVGGVLAAEFRLRHGSLGLPVATALMPRSLRTLGQTLNGQNFEVTPSARATLQRATVEHAWSDPALFVPLSTRSIFAAVRLTGAKLTFPVAKTY